MFCRELYLDEYTMKHFRSIKRKIKNRTVQPGIYVIILSDTSGRVEYMHSAFLCQKYYELNPPFVIGLAHSKESALEIIQKILSETINMRSDYDISAYLKQKTERISYKKMKKYRFTVVSREEKML